MAQNQILNRRARGETAEDAEKMLNNIFEHQADSKDLEFLFLLAHAGRPEPQRSATSDAQGVGTVAWTWLE